MNINQRFLNNQVYLSTMDMYCKYLLLVLAVLMVTACGNLGKDDQQLLQQAKTYLEQDNLGAAVIELKNALQKNPSNAEARYTLGKIYLDYGDYESATKEFRHAAKPGWQPEAVQVAWAESLLGQGKFEQLLKIIKIKGSYSNHVKADLVALKAAAQAGLGRSKIANQQLDQAKKLAPDSLRVLTISISLQLQAGDRQAASATLERALELYPDVQDILLWKARMLAHEEDPSAQDVYRKIIALDPPELITVYGYQARLDLAHQLLADDDLDQAETVIEPLNIQQTKDPDINYLAGYLAFKRSRLDLSEQYLVNALKIVPEHHSALLMLGVVNYSRRNYLQAVHYLSRYVRATPNNLQVRKLLDKAKAISRGEHKNTSDDTEWLTQIALAEIRQNEVASAKNEPDNLVTEKSDKLRKLIMAAELELRHEKYDEAIKTAARIQVFDPGNLAGQEIEGAALLGRQTYTSASRVLRNVWAKQQSSHLAIMLGQALTKSDQATEALKILNQWLAGNPDDADARGLLGNIYQHTGQQAEAIDAYKKVLMLEPENAASLNNLAWLYSLESNPEALELAKRAYSLMPDEARIMDTYGWLLLAKGQSREAYQLLEKAFVKLPDIAEVRFHFAAANLQTGDRDKGMQMIKDLLQEGVDFEGRNAALELAQ